MESDSLCVWKCASALSGTGVEGPVLFELLPPDPPPLPPELFPVLEELDRVVPLSEVFALEEMLPDELELDRTEACADAEVFIAEVPFTLEFADLELLLADESAEVEADAEDTPLVALAVNRLLVVVALPAPAPDEDPPVFEVCAATVPVVEV
jgi:hypothetical protein